ncbi:glutamate racemase [Candidatus Aerophobetes bacterium]|uniref:Glutamate racemase n=1 Tax=Aerophobetes bacterium TaxID=2030807 RepID=A0A662D787_UNCAE|nr:MAG: glutamate racemase [Candidatus Aerophobetes bacterium]
MKEKGVGIFDSGVGGLTVAREIMKLLPHEKIVYLGDTARLPYGNKSPETITNFSSQALRFFLRQDVKLIVVACNTVSALSLEALRQNSPLPLIGVLKPGARKGVKVTRNRIIGIIGTKATINSRAYSRFIKSLDPGIKVVSKSCPLLVPLVEEGWLRNKTTYDVVSFYLKPLLRQGIDTLILGCTHYPLLKDVFQRVTGKGVILVDSAQEVAKEVKKILQGKNIQRESSSPPHHHFFVSDSPQKFARIAKLFLGKEIINSLQKINLEDESV